MKDKKKTNYSYNPWPLGALDKNHVRPEFDELRKHSYVWDDPREIVEIFEKKLAYFWGAKYAVAVDCCSHAIFLSLKWLKWIQEGDICLEVPRRTYLSVPQQIIHAGCSLKFVNYKKWNGYYYLSPSNIIDAAGYWKRGGYIPDSLMCLSFQIKKMIPVGKMGAILTDDKKAYEWLKLASYDGRDLTTPYDSPHHVKMLGYHMYATPEDCARAILLMDDIKTEGAYLGSKNYPDVSKMFKRFYMYGGYIR